MEEHQEFIIDSKQSKLLNWRELVQYRELFYFFTWRDVKVKYKQTMLGVLWVVLQPLFMVLIFSLFFGQRLDVKPAGLPYPVFVFSGLLLWNFFSSSVNSAGNSMLTNAPIIKKIYFPRIIIPVSSLLVAGIDFIVAFIAFIAFLLYYHVGVSLTGIVVFWPLAIALTFCGTLGVSCWLSALAVKYRDFRYVIPFGLQVALFISPIIYPASILGLEWVNYVLAINPMYAAITLFRAGLVDTPLDMTFLSISIVSTFLFLLLGIYYFRRTEAYFADIA
jgi:lipopolysaccharide transport system permease protein